MEGKIIDACKAVQYIFRSEHGDGLAVTSRDKVCICLSNGNKISGRITDADGKEIHMEILKGRSVTLPILAIESIEQVEKTSKGRW